MIYSLFLKWLDPLKEGYLSTFKIRSWLSKNQLKSFTTSLWIHIDWAPLELKLYGFNQKNKERIKRKNFNVSVYVHNWLSSFSKLEYESHCHNQLQPEN